MTAARPTTTPMTAWAGPGRLVNQAARLETTGTTWWRIGSSVAPIDSVSSPMSRLSMAAFPAAVSVAAAAWPPTTSLRVLCTSVALQGLVRRVDEAGDQLVEAGVVAFVGFGEGLGGLFEGDAFGGGEVHGGGHDLVGRHHVAGGPHDVLVGGAQLVVGEGGHPLHGGDLLLGHGHGGGAACRHLPDGLAQLRLGGLVLHGGLGGGPEEGDHRDGDERGHLLADVVDLVPERPGGIAGVLEGFDQLGGVAEDLQRQLAGHVRTPPGRPGPSARRRACP